MNKKRNEKGFTLVELLATVVLTAIVSILVFSILTKALENTRIISQETVLRDEADLIASKFIKALYSTKQSHIIRNETGTDGSYLEVTTDLTKCARNENGILINEALCKTTLQPVGFKTANGKTKIHLFNEVYEMTNTDIRIENDSKINGNPKETSIYEMDLHLSIVHKRGHKETKKKMHFKNEVQPIVNSK